MEKAIQIIKGRIAECEKSGDMFSMPSIPGATIVENELPHTGAALFHTEYNVYLENGEEIHIDYQSKDKCRVFQIKPDRSVISVKCTDPSFDFSNSWDEKN